MAALAYDDLTPVERTLCVHGAAHAVPAAPSRRELATRAAWTTATLARLALRQFRIAEARMLLAHLRTLDDRAPPALRRRLQLELRSLSLALAVAAELADDVTGGFR